ncbi:MAG TPA: sigma-70 family RNA polymerase sigma factor [Gemmataceae bacterium]|nr:sigma-70 family RNA polymerase sigma factor [Gemmataceae bacterium]
MSADSAFPDLIRRVRGGDEAAATELVRLYEPAIRRSVRLRLDPRLRRTCDSMDICQAVLCSFFVRTAAGQYELDTPEQLLKLLASMARHKLAKAVRHQQAARRDHRRLEAGSAEDRDLQAYASGPSEQVAAKELVQEVQRRLSPQERRLMELRNQGCDWVAIAAAHGGSPEALRKQLGRAVARVAGHLGLEEVGHA